MYLASLIASGTIFGDVISELTGAAGVTIDGLLIKDGAIPDNHVTLARMADLATTRILGRATAGTGDPEALTGTQATALLDAFTSALKGLAPASGGGTANFLRADGTWATPPGGGGGSLEPIVLGIAGVLVANAQSWEMPAPETGTYNTIVARITDDNRSGSGDVIVGLYKNGVLAQSITVAFGSQQNDDPLSPAISLTKITDRVRAQVTTGQLAAANLVCQLLP